MLITKTVVESAERVSDKIGSVSEKIATLSKAGSSEEKETMRKVQATADATGQGAVEGALKGVWPPTPYIIAGSVAAIMVFIISVRK